MPVMMESGEVIVSGGGGDRFTPVDGLRVDEADRPRPVSNEGLGFFRFVTCKLLGQMPEPYLSEYAPGTQRHNDPAPKFISDRGHRG